MSLRLGRIYGIPIRIHYTLWIVFFLIAWSLAVSYMPTNFPGLTAEAYWTIGLASAALLFISVLIHELSHSIIAKRNGLPITRITLFFFGGVSEIGEEARGPWLEVRMAAAGPLTSLLLAALLGGVWLLSKSLAASTILVATVGYSASLNAILAGFNMIPAFPLDGGRVLRGSLWNRTGDLLRATSLATRLSQLISILMIVAGFLMIVFTDFITGLWIFFLGWFIRSGAETSLQQTRLAESLSGLKVGDLMTRELLTVLPSMSVEQLISDYFLSRPHRGYPVVQDGHPLGLITISTVRSVPREMRADRTVGDLMIPFDKTVRVSLDTDASAALRTMAKMGVGRVLVTDNDKLVGILTRGDLIKVMEIRR